MSVLRAAFDERLQEIRAYLALLEAVQDETQGGPPRLGEHGPVVSVDQQKMLYAGVYLQLYNFVEAMVSRCVDAVCEAALDGARWHPGDLSEELRREWVRFTARTHTELTADHRLDSAMALSNELVQALPLSAFEMDKGGGGNWDDSQIEKMAKRMGTRLHIRTKTRTGIKRPVGDDRGPLDLIRKRRNDLAHGVISFVECGEGVTVADLRDLIERTSAYLEDVVVSFERCIIGHEFLQPAKRPQDKAFA